METRKNLSDDNLDDIRDELEVTGADESVDGSDDQVYPMNGVTINKAYYTIFELKRKFDANPPRIKLDSEFQRDEVWGESRKAELVESVLMGLPLPIFYFNQDKFGNLIVVDGRQRLTALFQYMEGEYSLGKLKILTQFQNLRFYELSPVYQTRIEDYQISAHVIMPPTPDRIKFDIFDRVNRGGMQLNKQEIRNALYQGKATDFLKSIVTNTYFVDATGNAFANEKRMKDKYLITRFVTFLLYTEHKIFTDNGMEYIYKNGIDEFLGKGLDTINAMSDNDVAILQQLTIKALKKSFYYLGKDAFRLTKQGKKTPINMNVFETVMFIMLELGDDLNISYVKKKVNDFIDSSAFRDNIGNRRDSAIKLSWRLYEAKELGRNIAKNGKSNKNS